MSAFLCDDEHISALACYVAASADGDAAVAAQCRLVAGDSFTAEKIAQALRVANEQSLSVRYGDHGVAKCAANPFVFEAIDIELKRDWKRFVNAVDCFNYQACEVDNYATHPARILLLLARAVESHTPIGVWGWDRETPKDGAS